MDLTAGPTGVLQALRGCGLLVEQVVDDRWTRDLDVLFVMDNSPSMTPKQAALAQNIPRFIQKIEETGANYHIGVVTSDVGTQTAPGAAWGGGLGTACERFEGDDGTLQRTPCPSRTFLTQEGANACKALCPDPRFVPFGGQGFIARNQGQTNVPQDIVAGRDQGPQRAFQCMAMVGDAGCGIEGQFESARRALDGRNPLNAGFLRPGSLLAVIFITDEDDCSVQLSRRAENTPTLLDCVPGDRNADHRCFNPDYRCLARSLACDQTLDTPGEKSRCQQKAESYLEPVDRYVEFFTRLRPRGRSLIGGIWTLPALDRGGRLAVVYKQADMKVKSLNRATDASAGCYNPNDTNLFGQAQLRLSHLAAQMEGSIERSICDAARYPEALGAVSQALAQKLQTSCLDVPPAVEAGRPLCLVGEVSLETPDAVPEQALPVCSEGCCQAWAQAAQPAAEDPAIKRACQGEQAATCYCAVKSGQGVCGLGAVAGVVRKGPPPADRLVSFRCLAEDRCGLF